MSIKEIIITAGGYIIVWAITALCNFIKGKLSAKTRAKIEEIAAVVERIYDGCPSNEKLTAFKEICKNSKLNIDKAVKYLEEYIIPLSKEINRYTIIESVPVDENKEVN